MKTVGIIGGLGPETTAKFYLEIVSSCVEKGKGERPPILMWSIPLPLDIEEDLITKSQGEERYIPYLKDAAQRLEKGGADFLVIPCNSVHIFIKEVRESVSIPVLNIIEETIDFLKDKGIKEVGLLATATTLKSGLYNDQLAANGITVTIPDEEQQSKVGDIIFRLVNNKHTGDDDQQINEILNIFVGKGLKTVILACTDLQLLNLSHPNLEIYDTMKILVDSTIKTLG